MCFKTTSHPLTVWICRKEAGGGVVWKPQGDVFLRFRLNTKDRKCRECSWVRRYNQNRRRLGEALIIFIIKEARDAEQMKASTVKGMRNTLASVLSVSWRDVSLRYSRKVRIFKLATVHCWLCPCVTGRASFVNLQERKRGDSVRGREVIPPSSLNSGGEESRVVI